MRILGGAESLCHTSMGHRDLTDMAARESGPRALGMAGVTHADVDLCMIYDSFTITVLLTLENLGFCAKGEGGAFVQGGRLGLGGALPINTDGGGLSSNHPGHARHLSGDRSGASSCAANAASARSPTARSRSATAPAACWACATAA